MYVIFIAVGTSRNLFVILMGLQMKILNICGKSLLFKQGNLIFWMYRSSVHSLWQMFKLNICHKAAAEQSVGEFGIRAELCINLKEEGKLSLPGRQLFLQSGTHRMFPPRRLWEAQLRLWPALQIMTIPVLIRVLWLMFGEEGDRCHKCFQHVFFFFLLPGLYYVLMCNCFIFLFTSQFHRVPVSALLWLLPDNIRGDAAAQRGWPGRPRIQETDGTWGSPERDKTPPASPGPRGASDRWSIWKWGGVLHQWSPETYTQKLLKGHLQGQKERLGSSEFCLPGELTAGPGCQNQVSGLFVAEQRGADRKQKRNLRSQQLVLCSP